MQTFLPEPDFTESARILDDGFPGNRLGNQRKETMQLMAALTVPGAGWANHPAARMWAGYECALLAYQRACVAVWVAKTKANGDHFKDTCLEKTAALHDHECQSNLDGLMPFWMGDPAFHAAHRSNLLRKKPEHYGQFGWTEPDDLEYVWPV